MSHSRNTLGIAIVGFGGAVATTAMAGIELLKAGGAGTAGLPLADLDVPDLAAYNDLVFAGWDLCGDDLAAAAAQHKVLDGERLQLCREALEAIVPWPAVGNRAFCKNIEGGNLIRATSHREAIACIAADLARFKQERELDEVVVMNLASTERTPQRTLPQFQTVEAFEAALDANDEHIAPAMLYAYAAIDSGSPYGNFTPSLAADIPALEAFAAQRGVPLAGKDGKTGQTFVKTVLAPALKARSLKVDGWFSTNILGNRDGQALDDADSLASKVGTKLSVLDEMLGYTVEDHIVHIHYYKPRGDNKEAWDNIDISGFLGEQMQLKIDFLCKDSVLAAPLVIEICRCLALAKRRGESGVQDQLSAFFKMPQVRDGRRPEHAFMRQQATLEQWLGAAQ